MLYDEEMNSLCALCRRVLRTGTKPDFSHEELRKTQLLNGMSLVGFCFTFTFMFQSFWLGNRNHAIDLLIASILAISNWFLLAYSHRYKPSAFILTAIMGFLLLRFLINGGIDNSAIFWYYVFAPLTLFLHGVRMGSALTLILLLLSAVFLLDPNLGILQTSYSSEIKVRFLASNLAVFLLMLFYEWNRSEALDSLRQLSERFELLSQTDPLTGLLNRRGVSPLLQSQLHICMRYDKTFSILIADIDHFKQFNDQHGHECGDNVLQSVSLLIKKSLRIQDSVARWGGEEFLIMLPETNAQGALIVAEKIRRNVATQEFLYGNLLLKTTLSLGGATLQMHDTIDRMISNADQNLYQAKNEGRNRSVIEILYPKPCHQPPFDAALH